MARSSTTFRKGDGRAGRTKGRKSYKTLLMETIREEALLGADKSMRPEALQKLIIKHIAQRAFDTTDPNSATLLKELFNKAYPNKRAVMPTVEFDFDKYASPLDKCNQVLDAAAAGELAPDIAQAFITSISAMIKIEEVTELADRIKEVEKSLGVTNG